MRRVEFDVERRLAVAVSEQSFELKRFPLVRRKRSSETHVNGLLNGIHLAGDEGVQIAIECTFFRILGMFRIRKDGRVLETETSSTRNHDSRRRDQTGDTKAGD